MNYDHIFIDLAMTANPRIGSLTGIAAVRTDNKGNVLAAFAESLIATPAARKTRFNAVIDKFKEVIIDGSEHSSRAFEPSYVVVAWNAAADQAALKYAIEHESDETQELFKNRTWIDPMQMAWPLVYYDIIGDRSLESLCASFGIVNNEPGSAVGECRVLVKVYWALMARYKAGLFAEEVARGLGGKPLEVVRKLIGW